MSITRRTHKQYSRTSSASIITFMRVEAHKHGEEETAGYGDLTTLDFVNESVHWLMIDSRRVGFISVHHNRLTDACELRKVYVMPQFRRQGVVRFAMMGLKIQHADVPVGLVHFLGMCVRMGFRYKTVQQFPMRLAQLTRTIKETIREPVIPRYVPAR